MLDRERGKMSVRDQIPMDAARLKQGLQDFTMAFAGARHPHAIQVEPRRHLMPCLCDGPWTAEHARVRYDPQKGQDARPRNPDTSIAVELRVEPRARLSVLWHRCLMF